MIVAGLQSVGEGLSSWPHAASGGGSILGKAPFPSPWPIGVRHADHLPSARVPTRCGSPVLEAALFVDHVEERLAPDVTTQVVTEEFVHKPWAML